MREVAGKQLVCAFTAERHSGSGLAQLGQEPDRQCASIRAWLVRIVGKLGNGLKQVEPGIHVYLFVLSLILFYDLVDVAGFIKAVPVEGHRKSLKPRLRFTGCIVQNCRRIHPAAQPQSQRHI